MQKITPKVTRADITPLNCDETKMNVSKAPLLELLIMVKNGGKDFLDMLKHNLQYTEDYTILDTGSTDGTYELLKEFQNERKGQVYQEPFTNFRDSRNRLLDLSPGKCSFQIMLDDTYYIQNGEYLREFLKLARTVPDEEYESFSLYIHDTDYSVQYSSNRVLRTSRQLRYNKHYRIHEVIENNKNFVIAIDKASILDKHSEEMAERTTRRKHDDIKWLLMDHQDYPELPRPLYYLGETYLWLKDYASAAYWYEKRGKINAVVENYDEEQYDARYKFAYIHDSQLGTPWEKCYIYYLEAHKFLPIRPEAMFMIGYHYYQENNLELAFMFFQRAYKIGPPKGGMNIKLHQFYHYLLKFLAPLCIQEKEYQLGYEICQKYLTYEPNSKEPKLQYMLRLKRVFETLCMPINEYKFPETDRQWFIFATSSGWKPYTGETLYKEGLGGSETCIIRFAEHIAKISMFQPIIFCPCDDNGKIVNGVYYFDINLYLAFLKYTNPEKRHVAFLQRSPEYLAVSMHYKTRCYLHFHDTFPAEELIPDYKNSYLMGNICLSNWHKQLFEQNFPEQKSAVFGYAIDLPKHIPNKVRHSFAYTSFPNRGLVVLLFKMWPRILAKWPDARLHIFCDFDNQWLQNNYKLQMKEIQDYLASEKTVINHGWQPHSKLTEILAKTQFWLYPCIFAETFCLAALEAQAYRCIVITNDLGALKETVNPAIGYCIPGDAETTEWQDTALELVWQNGNNYLLDKLPSNLPLRSLSYNKVVQNFLCKFCYTPGKKITLMRHARSRFNDGLGDDYDCALSPMGIKQASQVTGEFDIVITSNLKRAQQTLQYSQIKYFQHLISDKCREVRNVSKCDYLLGEDLIEETPEQVAKRVHEFVKQLEQFHGNILVISHGLFLLYLMELIGNAKSKKSINRNWDNCEMRDFM